MADAQPEPDGERVDLTRLGFRSTQRLRVGESPGGGVVMATWPAELKPQALYLYGRSLGSRLVEAALERGWKVEPAPQLAYYTSPPERRLYMRPTIDALEYARQWEQSEALRRVGSHMRDEVERELWPWLKQRGYVDDVDDPELRRFLDEFLLRRPAHMRPGLRFRRVWPADEAAAAGADLAAVMREEFNQVFRIAAEPLLGAAGAAPLEPIEGRPAATVAADRPEFVREAIPERVRHEVWRRDKGHCVDCGSRERLEFDHIIPVSKGGSNTARNIELRCEACNRRKAAAI